MAIRKVKTGKVIENTVTMVVEEGVLLDETTNTITKESTYYVDDNQQFAMMYVSVVDLFGELDSTCKSVMAWCMVNCAIDSNIVYINKFSLEIMMGKFHVSMQTLRNAICTLRKHGVLVRAGNAVYYVHPNYSWRGDRRNRLAKAKMIINIQYNKNGKEV